MTEVADLDDVLCSSKFRLDCCNYGYVSNADERSQNWTLRYYLPDSFLVSFSVPC